MRDSRETEKSWQQFMQREGERQDRRHGWFAAFRDPDWELETPTTVANLLRQNPLGPLFFLTFFVFFATVLATGKLGFHHAIEVPLGVAAGTAAWWVVMWGFAKGWIVDE